MTEPANVTIVKQNQGGTVSVFCPRCDKEFTALLFVTAWPMLKGHVLKAHPEYDPSWHEADKFPPGSGMPDED